MVNEIPVSTYYLEHREERRAYAREYQLKNREKLTVKVAKWRLKNPGAYKKIYDKANKNRTLNFLKMKEFVGPCMKCGNSDGRVLEFHHLNPKEKIFDLTVLTWNSKSLISRVEELSKCEILCANCHRIETFESGKWGHA